MRRQQFKSEQSYIDWLKSKGCRFYAPMDEEHGTDELIQGWTFSVNNGCSCVWDSNKRAHLITGSSSASKGSAMWSGKSILAQNVGKLAITTEYTIFSDFNLEIESVGWSLQFIYGGSDDFGLSVSGTGSSRNVISYTSPEFYRRNNRTCSLGNWYTNVYFRNHGSIKNMNINIHGMDVMESDNSTNWAFVYNNNVDTHVSLMAGCSGYVRNLYIFATALSDEDIMTIYHHDHR